MPAAPPQLLNIVLQGNSILAGGGGVSAGSRPLAVIQEARPTATVTDVSRGGVDIATLRTTHIADVTSLYNPARRNIAVLLETSNYINDTRGEAAFGGDGLTLSDPNAAAAAHYAHMLAWVASVRAAGFQALVVTSPSAYEVTASPLSNNTQYQSGQDAAHALIRGNAGQFDFIADAAADARMYDTTNGTYFNADRIHLVNLGSEVLSGIILGPLPA